MSVFEYVMVLLSVVLSLALTQLLLSLAELVRAGRKVRWSATYVMWMLLTLALVLDMWTSLWLLRDQTRWHIGTLVFVLFQCSSIYLLAHLMTPREAEVEAGIDLWDFHLRNRRLYLAPVIAYGLAGIVMNLVLLPASQLVNISTWIFVVPVTVVLVIAWWRPEAWIQRVTTGGILAAMLVYFAFFFSSIG
jgi:hypothetical protein